MAILITAASHAVCYKVERLLGLPDVFLGDHELLPEIKAHDKKFVKIPRGSSATYAHELLSLALDAGITKIFPLYTDEIYPLASTRQLFSEYQISIIVPSMLWLKGENPAFTSLASNLVVLESGSILAGTLPEGINRLEVNLTGIFAVEANKPLGAFSLFSI